MVIEQEQETPTQLDLFQARLPARPYCSDDLAYGLQIRQAQSAIKRKHIQHNKPTSVHWLVFDCDYAGAIEEADSNLLPAPNLAIVNPHNGHSHLLYGLEVSVHRTQVARAKPLRFLAKVEYSLKTALKADIGYTSFICKNPLSPAWRTYELRSKSYDLVELADYLDLPTRLPKRANLDGLGRNCSLFELLRQWAYANVLNYRLKGSYDYFKEAVLKQAQAYNVFPVPLPQSEVGSTARSVAKWTWNNYTSRWPDDEWEEYVRATHLPEAQRHRQTLQVASRHRATEEKRATARLMASRGYTQQQIADELDVSQPTVYRWVKG
jgi:DNA-directed RNA polymerase specialized sigma24 family protein